MEPIHVEKFGESGNVLLAMWGRGNSGHNFSAITGDYLAGVRAAEEYFSVPVHVLRVAFKNDAVADFGNLDVYRDADGKPQYEVVGERNSVRMNRQGDVGYLPIDPKSRQPAVMAFLNADCPALFCLDRNQSGQVFGVWFAHAGLNCLVPEEASGASVLDTIRRERDKMDQGTSLECYLAGGVRACCYGLDDVSSVRQRMAKRYTVSSGSWRQAERVARESTLFSVVNGPRRFNKDTGRVNIGVDLEVICSAEIERVWPGFPGEPRPDFTASGVCATCLGQTNESGDGRLLWSHMWDAQKEGGNPRNFTCLAFVP